jgi:hypothetical protein
MSTSLIQFYHGCAEGRAGLLDRFGPVSQQKGACRVLDL